MFPPQRTNITSVTQNCEVYKNNNGTTFLYASRS